ncbi:MAG: hypothetical protein HYY25_16695 [Candidatus Wallbacteria bacterium]|nr:hypothetical protein [Candidatus Wallbacteria bacterium]
MNRAHRALHILLALGALAAACEAQGLSRVTISAPVGTSQAPFRTSFSQLAIAFGHDGGATGLFISQSAGADVNASNFLVNEASGNVGAFFTSPGLKSVSVRVTASPTGPTAVSQPTFIAFDNVPPVVTLTQIRIDPRLSFEPFQPGKTYFTSADAIDLRGVVADGPFGTPADQIRLTAQAAPGAVATGRIEASGQFEVTVSLAGLPEGPGQISISAADKMSDASRPNVGKGPAVRLGE